MMLFIADDLGLTPLSRPSRPTPREADRRRAGTGGYFASVCYEVFRLESAGISTYAFAAHLKSLAMQTSLASATTDELTDRLRDLQEKEQEASAAMDCTQMHYLASRDACLRELRDKAAAQASASEEMTAILDELIARGG